MTQRRRPRQRGQSLIEFALTLPILVIMMVGAWTVGKASYDAEIVRETAVEGGKMAAIDRVLPDQSDASQMDNKTLLEWINDAANNEDASIVKGSIVAVRGLNSDGQPDLSFDNNATDPQFANVDPKSNSGSSAYQGITGFLSGGDLAHILNPDEKSMEIKYNFDTGVGGGFTIPIQYNFDFQGYMMVWIPFGRTQGQ